VELLAALWPAGLLALALAEGEAAAPGVEVAGLLALAELEAAD